MGIVETSQRPESARVLRHRLLVHWTVYHVQAHLGRVQGGWHPRLYIIPPSLSLGFRVLFSSWFPHETDVVLLQLCRQGCLLWTRAPVLDLVRLWRLVLLNKDLNSFLVVISLIFICNFRLRSSRSFLCSRFACRKAFSVRSIAFAWLITNGAVV